jgi:dienelactone hydrolase
MPTRRTFLRALTGLGLPLLVTGEQPHALAQPAAPSSGAPKSHATDSLPTHADVGTLFPFIQSQAVRSDFPLSFTNARFTDVNAWKTEGRTKVFDLLQYTPPKCDAAPEVVERVDEGDYTREKIYFNTTPDLRVPAYVLVPKNAKTPVPGIVALHDHGGFYLWGKEKLVATSNEHPTLTEFKKTAYSGRNIASDLARQGYLVLVIDMFYWGERRMLVDDDGPDWLRPDSGITPQRIAAFNQRASQNEALVGRTIFSAGFTWAGVMFWDDIRTVDYLLTRPEVDPNRIGCVGLSVGGLRSCHLAALDARIKAAVVVGWMCSFPRQLQRHIRNTIGHTKLVPGLYRHLDYPDVAALAIPAALLVINGSKDTLFEPEGVRAAFDKLTTCYKKAGVPDKFRARLYDTPHEFNSEMQKEAWDWLKRWL